MEQLTDSQLLEKAEALSKAHGTKVHALKFIDPSNAELATEKTFVYGFLKEPDWHTKLMLHDRMMSNPYATGDGVLDLLLVKEETDPRLYEPSSDPNNHALRFGAIQFMLDLVKKSIPQLKKS